MVVIRSLQSVLKLFLFEVVVDRRVLTAHVDASLGLATCERCRFDQAAKLKSSMRSGAEGSPDFSHRQ